ncbi:MAG: hypothetical protein AB1847_03750 [bacterium]
MSMEHEEKLLEQEIESLTEEIASLSYKLNELLNVNCSFGFCLSNPEVDTILDKIKAAQEKKVLLEHFKQNIGLLLGEIGNQPH